jgi:hypothetical protein
MTSTLRRSPPKKRALGATGSGQCGDQCTSLGRLGQPMRSDACACCRESQRNGLSYAALGSGDQRQAAAALRHFLGGQRAIQARWQGVACATTIRAMPRADRALSVCRDRTPSWIGLASRTAASAEAEGCSDRPSWRMPGMPMPKCCTWHARP